MPAVSAAYDAMLASEEQAAPAGPASELAHEATAHDEVSTSRIAGETWRESHRLAALALQHLAKNEAHR